MSHTAREYEEIIAKLVRDGLTSAALDVARQARSRLGLTLALGEELEATLAAERDQRQRNQALLHEASNASIAAASLLSPYSDLPAGQDEMAVIPKKHEEDDLTDEMKSGSTAPGDDVISTPFPKYLPFFTALHKAPLRVAAFSQCGKWASTAAADGSVKIMAVKRMKEGFEGGIAALAAANVGNANYTRAPNPHLLAGESGGLGGSAAGSGGQGTGRSPIKTYTEHRGAVVDLHFHPTEQVLMSASDDRTLRFYDHYKFQKGSFIELVDPYPIRSAQFHPSGDFIAVAALHPIIRIYDTSTFKAYVSAPAEGTTTTTSHHTDAVNMVRWAPAGNMYCSASQDGTVRIWDTVTNEPVRVISNAHTGTPVTSAQFTASGKLILTSGLDSVLQLWDVNTGKSVAKYLGAEQKHVPCTPAITASGNHIVAGDEASNGVIAWDLRTGEVVKKIPSAHNSPIRWIACSPVEEAMLTAGADDRLKFWTLDPEDV